MAELFKRKGTGEPIEVNYVDDDNAQAISIWCGGVYVKEYDSFDMNSSSGAVNVPTASGMKRASEDSYVVRLETGDFDVLTPGEFRAQFDTFEEETNGEPAQTQAWFNSSQAPSQSGSRPFDERTPI